MNIFKAIIITIAMIVAEEAIKSLAKEIYATKESDD